MGKPTPRHPHTHAPTHQTDTLNHTPTQTPTDPHTNIHSHMHLQCVRVCESVREWCHGPSGFLRVDSSQNLRPLTIVLFFVLFPSFFFLLFLLCFSICSSFFSVFLFLQYFPFSFLETSQRTGRGEVGETKTNKFNNWGSFFSSS